MKQFLDHLTERDFQNRKVAFIENGTWAPTAARIMKARFEKSKNIEYAETTVTIKSAMTEENKEQIAALAKEMK
jgi:flavorubredoxin